ncbi:hypothetical protein JCM11641_002613 [Rhodosporidiobolus odoratus]
MASSTSSSPTGSNTGKLFNDFPWPFDLAQLLELVLVDPFAQNLVNSAANRFFSLSPAGEIQIRRDEGGCWGLLPPAWRDYCEGIAEEKWDETLQDLSRGEREDFPPTMKDYFDRCRTLSLARTCSTVPVLSFPPAKTRDHGRRAPPSSEAKPAFEADFTTQKIKGINMKNAQKAGKSPKKEHEVEQLSSLVQDVMRDAAKPITHCIDVGSGRAHLSRALAAPPINLHVLAIDWSSSQKFGAERIDLIVSDAGVGPTLGSLTHEVSSLDCGGVNAALARWPPRNEGEDAQPALLVALHACGDLTPASLRAFIESDADSQRKGAKAIFVGCCYNMLTPSTFPLSLHFRSLLPSPLSVRSEPMTREHLRLTPQSPPTWHSTPSESTSFLKATLKIAYRARFETELFSAKVGDPTGRRVGRVSEVRSWEDYRKRAIERFDYGRTELREDQVPEVRIEGGEEGWRKALFLVRIWWTVRSWLGPPMETACVVDRFCFLCEGLRREWEETAAADDGHGEEEKRRVEMVNVFDQATGSLRNLAVVVR